MDPDEVMRMLRSHLIVLSDMVSMRLVQGGSSLSLEDARVVEENAAGAQDLARSYVEWLEAGGFRPGQS